MTGPSSGSGRSIDQSATSQVSKLWKSTSARLADRFALPQVAPPRVLSSPLDLPTSLGYLNTAWRLRHERKHLLTIHSPERAASLAFDVASREEFFDRIGALCDTLKSFDVPRGGDQKGGHPVERMLPYLCSILPAESHAQIEVP